VLCVTGIRTHGHSGWSCTLIQRAFPTLFSESQMVLWKILDKGKRMVMSPCDEQNRRRTPKRLPLLLGTKRMESYSTCTVLAKILLKHANLNGKWQSKNRYEYISPLLTNWEFNSSSSSSSSSPSSLYLRNLRRKLHLDARFQAFTVVNIQVLLGCGTV
jgi:hypothetical protein